MSRKPLGVVERAARIGARADLADVRIRRIDAELFAPSPSPPFTVDVRVAPAASIVDSKLVYEVCYEVSSMDSKKRPVFAATIALNLLFELQEDVALAEADLSAFGEVTVLLMAHPYVREILQSISSRMGLPPLVLEVMRFPMDLPAALEHEAA
jgi:preprotein translocase subunit SecB